MQSAIKVLSIITIIWTSLALVNCLYLIGIVINSFLSYYRSYEEDLFIFGDFGLLQAFGIIILIGFLVSLLALDRKISQLKLSD